MMGLVKMASDGWAYYAREIAAGVEDYFVGHGEETGRWIGGPVIAELREALVELVGHLGELADVGESALPAERPDGHSDGPRGNVLRTLCVMTFVIPLVRLTRAFVVVGVVLTAGACSSHTAAAVNHPTPSPPTPERSATTSPGFSMTTTAQEAANCLGTQLSITGTQGVATGHIIWRVTFRNRSDDACNLSGYPTATAVDSPGKVLAVATPTPQGFAGGIGTSTHPPIVTLTPQAISTATIEALDAPASPTSTCVSFAELLVSAPGTSQQQQIIGGLSCSPLQLHPVLPGNDTFYP